MNDYSYSIRPLMLGDGQTKSETASSSDQFVSGGSENAEPGAVATGSWELRAPHRAQLPSRNHYQTTSTETDRLAALVPPLAYLITFR